MIDVIVQLKVTDLPFCHFWLFYHTPYFTLNGLSGCFWGEEADEKLL